MGHDLPIEPLGGLGYLGKGCMNGKGGVQVITEVEGQSEGHSVPLGTKMTISTAMGMLLYRHGE